jgi:YVTN family beta-propeller protein
VIAIPGNTVATLSSSSFASPGGIAITPNGATVYVANYGSDTVTPIPTSTNNTTGTPINVGSGNSQSAPFAMATTPNGATLYVANYTAGTVIPITISTNTAGAAIPVGSNPFGIAVTPDEAPTASFSVTPASPGSATSFNGSASGAPVGSITNYAWTFGDGATTNTTTATTTHTYATAGPFTATLTVTDTAGTSTAQVFTGQTVSNNGGPSAVASNTFTLVLPSISAVTPNWGVTAGGTGVTITGTGFVVGGTTAMFGSTAGTSVTCTSTTSCTAASPAEAVGTVDITVTTSVGTSATSSADWFTYDAVPTVTAISVNAGPVAGGTSVTVTGTGFVAGATTIDFGGIAGTGPSCTTTSCTATSPAGTAGAVNVTAVTLGGTSSNTATFTYEAIPTITSLNPLAGPLLAGTVVTITGTGFVTGTTATTVSFGGSAGTSVNCTTTTSCVATSPAGSGPVNVTVTTAGGTSNTSVFTYEVIPTVTGLSVGAGPVAGGTSVTVTGTGFVAGATTVDFGANAGTGLSCTTTSCTVTSPSHLAGPVNITAVTAGGTSSATATFTYDDTPTLTSVSPVAGPVLGGTLVTITGTGLLDASSAGFGGTAGTGFSCISDTTCVATSPAGSGPVNVTVTNATGTSSSTVTFTYYAVPTVTAISVNAGPVAGGTSVTVTGTGFVAGATTIDFGGIAGTGPSCTTTSCTATSPAGTVGPAWITVVTAGGTSPNTAAFTYEVVPSVTAISVGAGPVAGGTSVTVTGTGFVVGATDIDFGAIAGTSPSCTTTSCTATSPAGTAGAVNVTAVTAGGTSLDTATFTYDDTPTVTSVTPVAGPVLVGTLVTITGTGLLDASSAGFGGIVATGFSCSSDTTCVATSPAGLVAGPVGVTVTNATGISSGTVTFTYEMTGGSFPIGNPTTHIIPVSLASLTGAGILPSATWTDATGTGAGWNGTVAVSDFTYTGLWTSTPTGLGDLTSTCLNVYTDTQDGVVYTVTVGTNDGTTGTFTYTTTDTNDSLSGGTAIDVGVGTAVEVGTQGIYIEFSSLPTAGTVYQIQAGTENSSALTLNSTVNGAGVSAVTGTLSQAPVLVPTATTVSGPSTGVAQGYGQSYEFVSAAAKTGMGSYTVNPGVTFNADANSWAALYTANVQYTISTGP